MSDIESAANSGIAGGLLPLHPRMRWVWALSHGLVFTVPMVAVLVPLVVKFDLMPIALALPAAPALGLLLGWRYATRYAASYAALHLADGVLIRRGVWWRAEVFVPRARIQHTEVKQGPLDRRWGMASVSLHTAGTRLENITLPGLPRTVAEPLRDTLLDRHIHADGA
jgi:membrane protein YdbS with pleckstrin-like domain